MKKALKIISILLGILVVLIVGFLALVYIPSPKFEPVAYEPITPEYSPTQGWRTSTPEEQGMDSEKLVKMVEFYNYYEHTAERMLEYHLNESIDAASRNRSFIERSVEWIVSHFDVDHTTKIADFGCGPGLYTTMLAERGARVTGIDFSENSLEYAKQVAATKGLTINYVCTNYLDVETTQRFDLITMIMCDFCALSPKQRTKMLSKFHSMLKPDGSVLLDVYSLNSFYQKEESATYEFNQLHGFWSPEDYYCFVNTFKNEEEQVTLDKYTIIEASRTREVYNWLQYFSQDSLRNEFEEHGFKVEEVYLDVAGTAFTPDSPEMAIVARKL